MSDEIVVFGRKYVAQDGSPSNDPVYYVHNSSQRTWTMVSRNTAGGYQSTPLANPPIDVADDPDNDADTVKVEVTDSSNPYAIRAAINIVNTIKIIVAALKASNPNGISSVFGVNMTNQQVLTFISKSTFLINDTPSSNGGVGTASPNGNGGGSFKWYYAAFDGDLANSNGGDYASPRYENNQGMNAIVLHDIAHATTAGKAFNRESQSWSSKAINDRLLPRNSSFDGTNPFWNNNEAMAHFSARNMAANASIDISGWTPREGFNGVAPVSIYNELKNP